MKRFKNKKNIRSAIQNAGLLLASLMITALSGEAIIRLGNMYSSPIKTSDLFFQPDTTFHHTYIPDKFGSYISLKGEFSTDITVNHFGLREREISVSKPERVKRILLLGDSFVAAFEVPFDSTCAKQLERMLNTSVANGLETKYEVINGGIGSYSPILEYLTLKYRGLSFSPDLVILIFAMNDITDDYRYSSLAVSDREGLPLRVASGQAEPQGQIPFPFKNFFRDHSKFYLFIRERYHVLRSRIQPSMKKASEMPLSTSAAQILPDDIRFNPFAIFKTTFSLDEEAAWEQTQRYLKGITKLCHQANIPFLLLVMPEPPQINDWEWRSGKQQWGYLADETITEPNMQLRLQKFGKEQGLTVLDPTELFRKASNLSHPIFYDYDGHLTSHGNRVLAQLLYQEIHATGSR